METKTNQELTYEAVLSLATLFEERTEDPCEARAHASEPVYHDGPGEWLIRGKGCPCTEAGRRSKAVLVCDRFKTMVIDPGSEMQCMHCGNVIAVDFEILGRKGVDF